MIGIFWKSAFRALLSLMGVMMLTSCIFDDMDNCPHLMVTLAVKDKNYFNVNEIEDETARDENLPFREYVRTLHWTLQDAKTQRIILQRDVYDVTGDEKEPVLDLGNKIGYGDYVLTVWGNLSDKEPLGDDHTWIEFHPGHEEGEDIYMTRDLIHFNPNSLTYRAELERTKGKLIVEKIGFPAELKSSEKRIAGVYSKLDHNFQYKENTYITVKKSLTGESRMVSHTIVPPSCTSSGARLSIKFNKETKGLDGFKNPEDVNVPLKRNQISMVRYVWDEESGSFKIYVLINAAWQEYFQLVVE